LHALQETEARLLQQRIDELLEKEAKREATSKAAYENLRRCFLRNGVGGKIRTSAAELSTRQVVDLYERQLDRAREELQASRAEAELLRAQLFNTPTAASHAEMMDRRFVLHEAAQTVARAQGEAEAAKEQVASLQEELSMRPTLDDHERVQKENAILRRRVARLEPEVGATVAQKKSTKRHDHCAPTHPRYLTSFTARARHPGGRGQRTQTLSKAVLAELLEEAADILGCTHCAFEVPAAIRRLCKSASSASSMQKLLEDICAVVFDQGSSVLTPWNMRHEDPQGLPQILAEWIDKLVSFEQSQRVLRALKHLVARRNRNTRPPNVSDDELIIAVAELVDFELAGCEGDDHKVQKPTPLAACCPAGDGWRSHENLLARECFRLFGGHTSGMSVDATSRAAVERKAAALLHRVHSELISLRSFAADMKGVVCMDSASSLAACAKAIGALRDSQITDAANNTQELTTMSRKGPLAEVKQAHDVAKNKLDRRRRSSSFPQVLIYAPAGTGWCDAQT
jgi:hypothetical protein